MRSPPASARALAATLALSAGIVAPGSADAALQARASMSPTTIHYPGTRAITYRLELTTGDEPRTVHVSMIAPQYTGLPFPRTIPEYIAQRRHEYARYLTGEVRASGSPIGPTGRLKVSGAGTRLPIHPTSIPPSVDASSPYRSCARGYRFSWRQALLRLPARTTTTVVAHYRTGRSAPWRETDYRLAFLIRSGKPKPAGRPRDRVVRSQRPTIRGRTEPELRLRTTPPWWAALGRRIAVLGHTQPPVPHRHLRLLFRAGPHEPLRLGRTRLMANVRTDAQGRFEYRGWTASYVLNYELWATGGRRLESCSAVVRVGGRPPLL